MKPRYRLIYEDRIHNGYPEGRWFCYRIEDGIEPKWVGFAF
jgi:hypothetical protein